MTDPVCLKTGRLIKVYVEMCLASGKYADKMGDDVELLDRFIDRVNEINKDYKGWSLILKDDPTRDWIANSLKFLRKEMALPAIRKSGLSKAVAMITTDPVLMI